MWNTSFVFWSKKCFSGLFESTQALLSSSFFFLGAFVILRKASINLLKPTDYVMHIQLYVLPTLYLCVLYLSENKQRLVPLIS